MTTTDDLIDNNRAYAESYTGAPVSNQRTAVVACMDARMNVYDILGLRAGEAHVIRNAGGVITDDVIRSLAISQHLLGTREIVLIHHTQCGMLTFTDDEFRAKLRDEAGAEPDWRPGSFADLDDDVRQSIELIVKSPFIVRKDSIRGFVFDLASGELVEVS